MPTAAERGRYALWPAAVPLGLIRVPDGDRRPRSSQAVIALATGFAALCMLLVGVAAASAAAGHAGNSVRLVAATSGLEQAAMPAAVRQLLDPGTAHQQPAPLAAVPSVFLLFAAVSSWLIRPRGQRSIHRRIAVTRPGRGPPNIATDDPRYRRRQGSSE